MILLAIDPGPTETAYVAWDGTDIFLKDKCANDGVLSVVHDFGVNPHNRCVIEKIASFGMPVGAEVFETVYWSGRFAQMFGAERVDRITRIEVKSHLCHSARATDANIRQAIIDRFGGKNAAIGRKAMPGPLFGVKADLWSALAVGLVWWDNRFPNMEPF